MERIRLPESQGWDRSVAIRLVRAQAHHLSRPRYVASLQDDLNISADGARMAAELPRCPHSRLISAVQG